jgi:hypothetical protein
VHLGRAELVPVAGRELLDDELVEHALQILKVGHVAARAKRGVVADGLQPLDVLKARERSVRRWVTVGSGWSDEVD